MAFLRARASLSRRASLCDSTALSRASLGAESGGERVVPSVHKPCDPMPSQHTLLQPTFSIHLSPARMSQGSDNYYQCHMSLDPQISAMSVAASPVMSPIRPLSQESTQGFTYTKLSGPRSSSIISEDHSLL